MRLLVPALLLLLAPLAAFEPARPGREYRFPRDHFAHPELQIEWWYYTGNLQTTEGRRFGFELTFFRSGVEADAPPSSPWDIRDFYLAHFTLSDIEGGGFRQHERVQRSGPGLAGASLEQRRIWNGNWQAEWLEPDNPLGRQRLRAVAPELRLDLQMTPAKPPVIQGRDGVSQKADGEGKASYYISFTRLLSQGSIEIDGERFEVEGVSWMDHEISTDSMGDGQVGWDWMSIDWDDGTELMLYRIRREDGSTDPHSAGTFIDRDGRTEHLSVGDYSMTPTGWWTSPRTGARYPVAWTVEVPRLGLTFQAMTPLDGQEVVSRAGPSYWEGAVDYQGDGRQGRGYLEMTGYDKPLRLGVE
ncbi:MAG: carotenoid 1,2-hydratase [Acidobacteria bacterium]|nr:carotenoid 1,2-hydratase [Acidobacteriota bacterium]